MSLKDEMTHFIKNCWMNYACIIQWRLQWADACCFNAKIEQSFLFFRPLLRVIPGDALRIHENQRALNSFCLPAAARRELLDPFDVALVRLDGRHYH